MSSPRRSDCSWSSSTSRSYSLIERGIPLLLRARTLLELLAQIRVLLRPAHVRVLLGRIVALLRALALGRLALDLLDPQLLGLRVLHEDPHATPGGRSRSPAARRGRRSGARPDRRSCPRSC